MMKSTDEIYRVSCTVSNCGKRIPKSKQIIKWRFGLVKKEGDQYSAGNEQEITIISSIRSAKRIVLLNGVQKHLSQDVWKREQFHKFWKWGGLAVEIIANAQGTQYDLKLNGKSFHLLPTKDQLVSFLTCFDDDFPTPVEPLDSPWFETYIVESCDTVELVDGRNANGVFELDGKVPSLEQDAAFDTDALEAVLHVVEVETLDTDDAEGMDVLNVDSLTKKGSPRKSPTKNAAFGTDALEAVLHLVEVETLDTDDSEGMDVFNVDSLTKKGSPRKSPTKTISPTNKETEENPSEEYDASTTSGGRTNSTSYILGVLGGVENPNEVREADSESPMKLNPYACIGTVETDSDDSDLTSGNSAFSPQSMKLGERMPMKHRPYTCVVTVGTDSDESDLTSGGPSFSPQSSKGKAEEEEVGGLMSCAFHFQPCGKSSKSAIRCRVD